MLERYDGVEWTEFITVVEIILPYNIKGTVALLRCLFLEAFML